MNRRSSILERVRRLRNGAARQVVAAFLLAYVTAGLAPCATAAAPPGDSRGIAAATKHEHVEPARAHHTEHAHAAHGGHGVTAHDDHAPASRGHGGHHCPHCAGGALMESADHSSCYALEDLTSVAASHAKHAAKPLAPAVVPAAFTLPPPLASPPPPPLRAATLPPVPLNVRHCVFLI